MSINGEGFVPRVEIAIKARCPRGHETTLDHNAIAHKGGGCYGHQEDEYCYCSEPAVSIVWTCAVCTEEDRGKRKHERLPPCRVEL